MLLKKYVFTKIKSQPSSTFKNQSLSILLILIFVFFKYIVHVFLKENNFWLPSAFLVWKKSSKFKPKGQQSAKCSPARELMAKSYASSRGCHLPGGQKSPAELPAHSP